MMSEKPTDWLPYEGEMCHACDTRKAVRVVDFDGGHVALCDSCKAASIYERENY